MVWSFLWRAAIYAPATAWGLTWVLGFLMGLASSSAESVRNAGVPVQIAGVLLGVASAYLGAKEARKHPEA